MKAIITVDVPEHQIGQEVSAYFKDSMCVKGMCESETEVYAKHDEEVIKETVASIWGKPPYIEYIDNLIDKCMETLFDATLDKIRAEIEEQIERDFAFAKTEEVKVPVHYGTANGLQVAVRIIDKYKKENQESEEQG